MNGRFVSIIATCMHEYNKLSCIYNWVKAFNWFVRTNRRRRACYFIFLINENTGMRLEIIRLECITV